MCVPCAAKKLLNEDAQGIVNDGERLRKRVKKQVDKGRLTEDQAAHILEPYMDADRAYIALAKYACPEAEARLADAEAGAG